MRRIVRIEHVEPNISKEGKKYWKTYAVLDDGTEAVGFGNDFDLEDKVEVFFHDAYDVVKMRHTPNKEKS